MHVRTLQDNRSRHESSSTITRRFKQALLFGLILPFVLVFSQPAHAQTEPVHIAEADTAVPAAEVTDERSAAGFAISSSTWQTNFDEQAAKLLRGEYVDSIRDAALHNVIVVATQSPNDIDLSSTVGALLQIVENDADETRRLTAIQALHVIGTEHAKDHIYRRAMERLHQIVEEESSERVRGAAAIALATVYRTTGEAK